MPSLAGLLFRTKGADADHARRTYSGDFVPDAASDPGYEALKGDNFPPEESYFSVRLVEMRLAEGGNYISDFLPLCSCFLRYTYGNTQREMPFMVGYDMIRTALGKNAADKGARNVEFRNIYIVRNAPVKADGLVMYAALCRVADSSFARGMLDLLTDAAGAIGGPAAGTLARTGVDMTKRLGSLLGADGVSTRFGVLDGAALRKSGYRVFAGTDMANVKELRMENGQLLRHGAGGSSPVDDADYLVVAFEHRKTLVDNAFGANSHLQFHASWEDVKTRLLSGDLAGADQAFKALTLKVVTSPDLVEADRLGIITTYLAQAEQWKKAAANVGSLRAGREGDITTRLTLAADDTAIRLEQPVSALLKSASNLIDERRNEAIADAAAALDPAALTRAAHSIRAALDRSCASPSDLSRASAQLASAAMSRPL